MINKENFNILEYVKKEEYTGSTDGMRFMIKKSEEGMTVTIWPEPYAYAYTDESLKQRKTFPLSAEGVSLACDYLNEQLIVQKDLWDLNNPRKKK